MRLIVYIKSVSVADWPPPPPVSMVDWHPLCLYPPPAMHIYMFISVTISPQHVYCQTKPNDSAHKILPYLLCPLRRVLKIISHKRCDLCENGYIAMWTLYSTCIQTYGRSKVTITVYYYIAPKCLHLSTNRCHQLDPYEPISESFWHVYAFLHRQWLCAW